MTRVHVTYVLREVEQSDTPGELLAERLAHFSRVLEVPDATEADVRSAVLELADGREVASFTWRAVSDGGKV